MPIAIIPEDHADLLFLRSSQLIMCISSLAALPPLNVIHFIPPALFVTSVRPSVRPITPSVLRHLVCEIRWSPPSISTPISSISAMSERSFYIVCPPERSVSFYTVKQMNMLLRLLTSVKSNICTYIVRSVRSFPVVIPHALTISPIRPRSPWHRRSICIIDYIIKY